MCAPRFRGGSATAGGVTRSAERMLQDIQISCHYILYSVYHRPGAPGDQNRRRPWRPEFPGDVALMSGRKFLSFFIPFLRTTLVFCMKIACFCTMRRVRNEKCITSDLSRLDYLFSPVRFPRNQVLSSEMSLVKSTLLEGLAIRDINFKKYLELNPWKKKNDYGLKVDLLCCVTGRECLAEPHKWNTTNINIIYAPLGSYIAENCGLSEISRNEQREKMRYIDGLNCRNFAEIFSFMCNITRRWHESFELHSK